MPLLAFSHRLIFFYLSLSLSFLLLLLLFPLPLSFSLIIKVGRGEEKEKRKEENKNLAMQSTKQASKQASNANHDYNLGCKNGMTCSVGTCWSCLICEAIFPTDPFTILGLWNPSIDVSELHEIRWLSDLRKGRSGRRLFEWMKLAKNARVLFLKQRAKEIRWLWNVLRIILLRAAAVFVPQIYLQKNSLIFEHSPAIH